MHAIQAEVIDDFELADERFLFLWDEAEARKLGLRVPLGAELGIGDRVRLDRAEGSDRYTVTNIGRPSRRAACADRAKVKGRAKDKPSAKPGVNWATLVTVDSTTLLPAA
jgi:hypothetical protein